VVEFVLFFEHLDPNRPGRSGCRPTSAADLGGTGRKPYLVINFVLSLMVHQLETGAVFLGETNG
jgi:hypothetical protein